MSLVPVLVMDLILLVITVLLATADRLLVTYGECTITVARDEEEQELVVQGGDFLMNYLTEHKISVSNSCGGKATCGYCKVKVSGGGPILPTEEIFMSRQEKLGGMRLACQVKVKNDLDIFIPDFLEIVKNIVKNRTYDPSLRWKFNMADRIIDRPEDKKKGLKFGSEEAEKIQEILEQHKDVEGFLVPILQKINTTFNYIPEPALRTISGELNIPLSQLYRLSTFYNAFSLEPKGRNIIKVCMGTACYVKGGKKILKVMEEKLGIKVGKTTDDLKFSLETVSCIGCCGQAPGMTINEDIYGYLKQNMINDILRKYI